MPHGIQDLSSPTRDRTRAPCSGSAESEPLDGQGIPKGRLILIHPLECLSVQLWKEQGLEVRGKGPTVPTPFEDIPFLSYSVRNLGQTIGRTSAPQGMVGRHWAGDTSEPCILNKPKSKVAPVLGEWTA